MKPGFRFKQQMSPAGQCPAFPIPVLRKGDICMVTDSTVHTARRDIVHTLLIRSTCAPRRRRLVERQNAYGFADLQQARFRECNGPRLLMIVPSHPDETRWPRE